MFSEETECLIDLLPKKLCKTEKIKVFFVETIIKRSSFFPREPTVFFINEATHSCDSSAAGSNVIKLFASVIYTLVQ